MLKVVTGVSIGSINAACVVGAKNRADARARLNALWDDLMLEAPPFWMAAAQRDLAYFGLPGFYTPRPDFWTAPTWTYVYDTRPLLVTLGRHVDFAALNASPTAFVVTAVEVVTGTLQPFANQTARRTCLRPRSSRAMCWRAAACRRDSPGPRSTACPTGTAASSTILRSAWPSTRSAPIRQSTACSWS